MKGLELPINVLIIIAVAVIVLIAIIAMFYPAFSSGSSTVNIETAKSQACRSLVAGSKCSATVFTYQIPVYKFDANKDGTSTTAGGTEAAYPAVACGVGVGNDNLARLCWCYYQLTTDAQCRAMCGC